MKDKINVTSYLYEDELIPVQIRMAKMKARYISLKKVVRALLILWAKGEIELDGSEIINITPDGRVHNSPWRKSGGSDG